MKFSLFLFLAGSALGQSIGSQGPVQVPDEVYYRHLFRHVAAFNQRANQLDGQWLGQGNAFRYFFKQKASLSLDEADSLTEVAVACDEELKTLNAKIAAIVSRFRADFPIYRSPQEPPPPPPVELRALGLERDRIVLRYRDELKARLSPASLQRLNSYTRAEGSFTVLVAALSTSALLAEVSQTLLQALHSSDWQERAAAAQSLAIDPDRRAEGDTELVALLAREDSVVRAAYKEGPGAAAKYGEEYAEYVAALSDVVDKIAEKNPERSDVWPALLDAPYLPDSAFVRWLGTHADKAIGLLLPKAGSPDALTRGGAVETLGRILGVEQGQPAHKISTAQMRAIEVVARSALRDKDAFVRGSAMSAVAAFGTRDDIPMLERAVSDPEAGFHAGFALKELRQRLDNATPTPAAIRP